MQPAPVVPVVIALVTALAFADCSAATPADELCDGEHLATLPEPIVEASGIVASRRHPGVFWVHNDSEGTPALYAIDVAGALIAEIDLPGAGYQSDWEDIAIGPCPAGTCLYIGDIGDNLHDRDDRAILRLPEPEPRSGTASGAERFPFGYPDRPRDAEALLVLPDTSVYIISKGRSGPVVLYRYPPPLRPDERVTLVEVQQLTDGLVQLPRLVTAADALPDGSLIAVRSYSFLQLYRMEHDTLATVWPAPGYDLGPLNEPQGEGVAIRSDGTVYLVSETGPERRPPPFSRLRCALP